VFFFNNINKVFNNIKDLKAYTWDDSELSLDVFKRVINLR